jgi:cell division protein FtsI/penicillin-binding protein 2
MVMALPNTNTKTTAVSPVLRIRIWYGFLLVIVAIFVIRLFYVQVIRYDHYKNAALSDQLKQYQSRPLAASSRRMMVTRQCRSY